MKGKLATLIGDNVNVDTIFLQFPGRSAKEMPSEKSPNGVIIIEVDALSLVH